MIIILSGGIIEDEGDGQAHWRSTTYDEGDAFGTLGGRDRAEAAAFLAQKYPHAYLVTTSRRLDGALTTQANVYAAELQALGVAPERIIKEERSTTTGTAVEQAVQLAQEKGWKHILFLSSEYHLLRIEAFYTQTRSNIVADFVSSESILVPRDPAFAEMFERVKRSPEYKKRLLTEAQGIEAIRAGTYRSAPLEDKLER